MKTHWVRRDGGTGLILFLNGWGMDGGTVRLEPPSGWDLVTFFDYRDLEVDEAARHLPGEYATVVLVAWSMGVWAAGGFAHLAGKIAGAVAVNGTRRPIDDGEGIPRRLYEETVRNFSEASRQSFTRRMCGGGPAAERFNEGKPQRELEDQRQELEAIRRHQNAGLPTAPYPFDAALIGSRDRIVPPLHQRRHWKSVRQVLLPGMPHFPFFHLGWEALLEHAGLRR
jgi:biotin synthesis protein BioG